RGVDVGADFRPIQQLALSGSASAMKLVNFENSNSLQTNLNLNAPTFKVRGSVEADGVGLKDSFLRVDGRYHTPYPFASGYWNSQMLLGHNVPSRVVLDATLGYKLPKQHITITGTVANLLDNQTPDLLGAPIPRRLMWLQLAYDWQGLRY